MERDWLDVVWDVGRTVVVGTLLLAWWIVRQSIHVVAGLVGIDMCDDRRRW
jgi:hypothetical protein